MKKRTWRIMLPVVIVLLIGAVFVYAGVYYHAEPSAAEALVSDATVAVTETDYGWFFDGPGSEDALIFYPGGKVDETAYAPFLRLLAERDMDVCLVKMPFHLAVLGMSRADGVIARYEYERWYIGGHSLGGAVAAIYAAAHESLSGVILCAAYPTKPLEADMLEVCVYASEDGVLDPEKLAEGRAYATDNLAEVVIDGGNHAQFGCYGVQSGDCAASIPAEEQQKQAAGFILESVAAFER